MFDQIISNVFHFFQHLGIFGAFLSMLIENIGIPLPTEIGYLIAQDLINRGVDSYILVLIVLTLGHVFGSVVSFGIGRFGGNFVEKKLKKNPKITEVHEKIIKWYEKYGNFTIFLTRFVGYVRPWSSFVAGFAETEFSTFLILTTIGSLIFNIMVLYFSGIVILIWRKYAFLHVVMIGISLLLFFGFIVYEIVSYLLSVRKRDKS